MLRIVALNEEDQEEQSDEEIVATKEAQETIAEYEYVRAVKLKFQKKPKLALSLLLELLDTEVLNVISDDESNKKLWAIRYNCHKNVATISEEMRNFGMALENYVLAMQLDSTDVHTIHRFGHFVLKRNALELAQCAFENCLKKNPAHWSAAEGLLQTLCRSHNILGAYGLALKLYRQNSNYKTAAKTLSYIYQMFKNVPFFEHLWGSFPEKLKHLTDDNKDNQFLPKKVKATTEMPEELSLKQFAMTNMSFTSMAHYILNVFDYLQEKGSLHSLLSVDDMIASEADNKTFPQMCTTTSKMDDVAGNSNETPEGNFERTLEGENISSDSAPSKSETQCVETANVEGPNDEGNGKGDNGESSKSKPRRRCSDLHFLEQWGWHKNRRYASRRKGQERPETDTSLKGFLRRMFVTYTSQEFKDEWPFMSSRERTGDHAETVQSFKCSECEKNEGASNFALESEKLFDTFVKGLKAKPFDIVLLIFKWLKSVSTLWNFKLPEELKSLYLKIYTLYLDLYDFGTWQQMSCKNFEESTNICLLYLELKYSEMCANNDEKNDILPMWSKTFDHLMYMSGTACIALQNVEPFKMRLLYIKYLCCSMSGQLEETVMGLKDLELLMADGEQSIVLHVPNLTDDCLTKVSIRNLRLNIQRELELNKVVDLFEQKNWPKLVHIIRDSILYCKEEPNCENWLKDFKVQMEILLQSYWKVGSYEECLMWTEKYLHYATYNFLNEMKGSYRRILWEESINFALSYIEALTANEGYDILNLLEDRINRLVQNCIRILSNYLDSNIDKNANPPPIDFKRLWVTLHQLMLREENSKGVCAKTIDFDSDKDEEDLIPNSYLILFTGHEFIGKHQWCTKDNGAYLTYILDVVAVNVRAPCYDTCRDILYEYIEQVTFCLYGYPQKRARCRHIEDHEASPIELSWTRAIQLFDLYRPDNLPEFNSYKLESISSDMEQLLLRIVSLMPNELDTNTSAYIVDFIKGEVAVLNETASSTLPFKINSIFYLLADYYFKNRDFLKTTKYYKLDLACNPTRYDSWAGMSLSKASKVESKINMFDHTAITNLLSEGDEVIRCFERCIALDRNQTLLWIEYGSFTYILHSHCSRHLKHNSENLSMEEFSFIEERKERMLNIAFNCFTMSANLQSAIADNPEDHDDSIEDKWLSQYMLGKISEKRKETPSTYLNYYLKAANYLYESNATYPIKINHNNPTTLSVEALEVFYRTNSAIMKYLEHESTISREIGNYFKSVLSILSKSPFAFNKAKIDGNSLNVLKRKVVDKSDADNSSTKILKESKDAAPCVPTTQTPPGDNENVRDPEQLQLKEKERDLNVNTEKMVASNQSPYRRQSQESGRTGTTTTVTSSATSSSSSSDSTSSESDTDAEVVNSNNSTPYTKEEIEHLMKTVVGNLEECITRFPEHYKSIYRLVFHYLNGPNTQAHDLNRCQQLLMGQYRTVLGNQINGLFFDRKTNNLFNGIWRIPSSEVDRPGSFSAHLAKCISILIQVLMKSNNYNLLIDIGLQLFKTPEHDKRYIKDDERIELYRQCITYCAQVLRKLLKNISEKRDDKDVIELLINIYKIHKKCTKHFSHKEPLFTQLLVDVYKYYISDKVEILPDNLNFLDLAIKLCVQQLSASKSMDKCYPTGGYRPYPTSLPQMASPTFTNINLPSTKPPRMQSTVKPTINTTAPVTTKNLSSDGKFYPTFTPALFADLKATADLQTAQILRAMQTDTSEFQRIYAECYKQACEQQNLHAATTSMPTTSVAYAMHTQKPPNISMALPSETTITPSNLIQQTASPLQIPLDAKKLSHDITITPCSSKQTSAYPMLDSVAPMAGNLQRATTSGQYYHQENTTVTQKDAITTTTTTTTYKEKTVSKTKSNFPKPYSRGVTANMSSTLQGFGHDMATISLLHSQQQTEILSKYADILKIKTRSPSTNTNAMQQSATSLTISSVAGIQAQFNLPKFDSNVISLSTVPTSSNGSSGKTLQQKLIERQKANQKTEASDPAKSNVDVIILD